MKQQANKTKKINMTIDFAAPIEDKMQTCIIPAFLYYITLLARKACEREGGGRDKKKGSHYSNKKPSDRNIRSVSWLFITD